MRLLTLPLRHAGGRELLLHAIVRQNLGCSALLWEEGVVGFSIVEAGRSVEGLAIRLAPCAPLTYVEARAEYLPLSEAASEAEGRRFGGAEMQRRLRAGLDIPAWISFREVLAELRGHFPAR